MLAKRNENFAYHFISQAYKKHGNNFDPTEFSSLVQNLSEQLKLVNLTDSKDFQPEHELHKFFRTPNPYTKKVVIIDAVDEVNRHPNFMYGLLPHNLAEGNFVILSARKKGEIDYLREIGLDKSCISLYIDLPGLDLNSVKELLGQVSTNTDQSNFSEHFIQTLYKVSEGDPFYLRFLVEDISMGRINELNVNSTPTGLNAYLDLQLSILDRSAHLSQQRDILGYILDSYSPLSRADLINLIDGLDRLNFNNIIRDIHRYLLVYNDCYSFCHYRFKEYFSSNTH